VLSGSYQPSLQSFIQRMSHELNAKAVLLFDGGGQIIGRAGWLEDEHFPAMAALAAAMISAAQSLGALGESFGSAPSRFSCDSEETGLYTVAVGENLWLTALYDQPENPGKIRMRVRRFGEALAKLQSLENEPWEAPVSGPKMGVTLIPAGPEKSAPMEKLTGQDSTLFSNITDDEIDRLFENPSS
jgi:predicted regulator of Ras-like GTPase activity (Roadblock/LC7/MglB family)